MSNKPQHSSETSADGSTPSQESGSSQQDGAPQQDHRARKSIFREYAEAIVIAVILAFTIRVFVVQAFKIPSGSMIPSLQIGDHILVSKLSYGIQLPQDCKLAFNFLR